MPYSRGRVFTLISILFGCASAFLSIYVLSTCDFYEATWTSNDGDATLTETPGLFLCKVYDSDQHPKFTGPTNGFDIGALIGGFGGAICGTVATLLVIRSWFRSQSTAFSGCLFTMAVILQGMTGIILISGPCGEAYEGTCKLLTNGWLSIGAAGGWLLASLFNRETTRRQEDLPK